MLTPECTESLHLAQSARNICGPQALCTHSSGPYLLNIVNFLGGALTALHALQERGCARTRHRERAAHSSLHKDFPKVIGLVEDFRGEGIKCSILACVMRVQSIAART